MTMNREIKKCEIVVKKDEKNKENKKSEAKSTFKQQNLEEGKRTWERERTSE